MRVLGRGVAWAVAACVLLAGCGAKETRPTASVSSSSSPSASSSASKPVDPASLPAPTAVKPERPPETYVNSEEAFVEYFKYYYNLLTYTKRTGDTAPIREEIYTPDCEGCTEEFDKTDEAGLKGIYGTGCDIRYEESPRIHYYDELSTDTVAAEVNGYLGSCVSTYADGSLVNPDKPSYNPDLKARLYLAGRFMDGRWQVTGNFIEIAEVSDENKQ